MGRTKGTNGGGLALRPFQESAPHYEDRAVLKACFPSHFFEGARIVAIGVHLKARRTSADVNCCEITGQIPSMGGMKNRLVSRIFSFAALLKAFRSCGDGGGHVPPSWSPPNFQIVRRASHHA
jgi:hypothetical protein